jgi:hypothetical protein
MLWTGHQAYERDHGATSRAAKFSATGTANATHTILRAVTL